MLRFLILQTTLGRIKDYFSQFTDEKTEASASKVLATCKTQFDIS
jgi:hypothetical protein